MTREEFDTTFGDLPTDDDQSTSFDAYVEQAEARMSPEEWQALETYRKHCETIRHKDAA